MTSNGYDDLLKSDEYQVFLLHCPVTVPLQFASHPWFVCNERGSLSRYEVLDRLNEDEEWAYMHKDHFPTWSGIEVWPLIRKEPLWEGRLLGVVEGERAKRMIEVLRTSPQEYPIKEYSLIGTNSNTFAQWVLDRSEVIDLGLPWNSFGKNAAKRKYPQIVRRMRERLRSR
ncbi:MAG TPA: DUF3750 domain-containing protein [Candidatus Fimivivens sp.]|nr:DUF3750 domain-containing protein [Candidatus Fimivivens sp.]